MLVNMISPKLCLPAYSFEIENRMYQTVYQRCYKDKKIKDVANEYEWSSIDSNSKEVNYFVSEGGKTIDGSITPFTRFADGIFFSDDWWSNPFAPDLI